MYYEVEAKRIAGQLAAETQRQTPEYRAQFDAGADALRRSIAERRTEQYGRVSEWEKLTEWQRGIWRKQFTLTVEKARDETLNREVHSGPEDQK